VNSTRCGEPHSDSTLDSEVRSREIDAATHLLSPPRALLRRAGQPARRGLCAMSLAAPRSLASLVAALDAPAPGAAAFTALERRVSASTARAAEATSRGAVRFALPWLLLGDSAPHADAAARDAAVSLLAALAAASQQAAAAALGLENCVGDWRTRLCAVLAASFVLEPDTLGHVPDEAAAQMLVQAPAAATADALVRLACDSDDDTGLGDAAVRLALALLAAPQRYVRDVAVGALLGVGVLTAASAALRRAAGADDEAPALRCAARAAHLLARLYCAATFCRCDHNSVQPRSAGALILTRQVWRGNEVALADSCAVALAATRAPPLQALRPDALGWAGAQRCSRASLCVSATALLCTLVQTSTLLVLAGMDDDAAVLPMRRVAAALARRPGAFAGLAAGVHALCLLRGHVMHPLPPLLHREPKPGGPCNPLLAHLTHGLFNAAVTWRPEAEAWLPPELAQLRLFSAAEAHAGLSYGVLFAALRPYHEASAEYDHCGSDDLSWRLLGAPYYVPFASRLMKLRPPPAQHPAPFAVAMLLCQATQEAALAAVAAEMHVPVRARDSALQCGAHELSALVVAALLDGSAAAAFALRTVLHMLGRALCAGDERDDARLSGLLRRCGDDTSSYNTANPGTRLFLAQQLHDRRAVAASLRATVRQFLEGLAWVRAAETGAEPAVSALGVDDLRSVAHKFAGVGARVLAAKDANARTRAQQRRSDDSMLLRDALLASSAITTLRIVQGGGGADPVSLWGHAAWLGPSDKRRPKFFPYGGRYFTPAATAKRVAAEAAAAAPRRMAPRRHPPGDETREAEQAQVQPQRPAQAKRRRPVQPPPPPPLPARVPLRVGAGVFAVPTAQLQASPYLSDLLRLHCASPAATSPLRLCLGADLVPAEAATTAFTLLLTCLEAAEARRATDAAFDAAVREQRFRRGGPHIGTDRRYVLPAVLMPAARRALGWLEAHEAATSPDFCRHAPPWLMLPTWNMARHLQLDDVIDALGDPLTEWLSRQNPTSLAWRDARDAAAASPEDDDLAHVIARAEVRAAARAQFALLRDDGEEAASDAFAAWLSASLQAVLQSGAPGALQTERAARWATALGRALHAEEALLCSQPRRGTRARWAWQGDGRPRRAAARCSTTKMHRD